MSIVTSFTFNEFQENTYVIHDETSAAIIIDPGCNSASEQQELVAFVQSKALDVQYIVNTHCHVDHVFGNAFCVRTYGAPLWIPEEELQMLQALPQIASMCGFAAEPSPEPSDFLVAGTTLSFGQTALELRATPGHSPASISMYCAADQYVIAGDVLFSGSIGRTDLPGGSMQTLLSSIRSQLLTLSDDVIVYPGHGPQTTIGQERISNPFLQSE